MAEAVLGDAAAVERGGVIEADAEVPGGRDRRLGTRLGDHLEQVAERGSAEADHRDLEAGLADRAAFGGEGHCLLPFPHIV
jgi:hypothetical protein